MIMIFDNYDIAILNTITINIYFIFTNAFLLKMYHD